MRSGRKHRRPSSRTKRTTPLHKRQTPRGRRALRPTGQRRWETTALIRPPMTMPNPHANRAECTTIAC